AAETPAVFTLTVCRTSHSLPRKVLRWCRVIDIDLILAPFRSRRRLPGDVYSGGTLESVHSIGEIVTVRCMTKDFFLEPGKSVAHRLGLESLTELSLLDGGDGR